MQITVNINVVQYQLITHSEATKNNFYQIKGSIEVLLEEYN